MNSALILFKIFGEIICEYIVLYLDIEDITTNLWEYNRISKSEVDKFFIEGSIISLNLLILKYN